MHRITSWHADVVVVDGGRLASVLVPGELDDGDDDRQQQTAGKHDENAADICH